MIDLDLKHLESGPAILTSAPLIQFNINAGYISLAYERRYVPGQEKMYAF